MGRRLAALLALHVGVSAQVDMNPQWKRKDSTTITPRKATDTVAIGTTVLGPKTLAAGDNQLPAAAAGNAGQLTRVTDAANALDCTGAGGGTAISFCYSNGAAWSAAFGSVTGSKALGEAEILANACAAALTETVTGLATTDVIHATFNADVSAVTGYGKASTDGLIVYVYPTANTVNIKVCNATGAAITPGAATLNWRVTR